MTKALRGVLFLAVYSAAWALGASPTGAETLRAVRQAGLDAEQCYRVRDLNLDKEDIHLYFTEGYLIFSRPVAGEPLAAIFSADVEGGDGEILLLPPHRGERQSLAKFTNSPNLDEHFRTALLVFTDGSGRELLERIQEAGGGRKAPEMGLLLADQWSGVVANIAEGFGLRLLEDLLTPGRVGGGFLFAALTGDRLGNFDVLYEPRVREQIVVGQLAERRNRVAYNVWTSFSSRSSRTGNRKPPDAQFAVNRYKIDAGLDPALRLKAVTSVEVTLAENDLRVFPFDVSRAMNVTAARIDGMPAELLIRESARGRALRADENDVFLVVAPELLSAGSRHEIEFDHEGDVISRAGNGVYSVGGRANWYPQTGDNFAAYDLTFRYPRNLDLVLAGDVVDERVEGDWKITHRRPAARIRIAGFNLGTYDRVESSAGGYKVEVYGNRRVESALQPPVRQTILLPSPRMGPRGGPPTLETIVQVPAPPDPKARLRVVADDVAAALQFFAGRFGPPPLKTLTVSPIPGTFGHGFSGLVYLSPLAYLNPNERPANARGPRQQVFFSDIIQAHEVAHQWWGNVVTVSAYQDEWLMEALASYSALLWLEKKKGTSALEEVLADYRDNLVNRGEDGALESAGPITWGFRLDSGGDADAFRAIIYEKGAWILHMLRRRLGDDRFWALLRELRRRYEFRPVTTDGFAALVKEFLPPRVSKETIDSFFENWAYATGVPDLKVTSSIKGKAPSVRVTGTVEQKGVAPDFSVDVPVEIHFDKGAPQIVWVRTSDEPVPFAVTLKQVPVRVSIPAGTGVLAVRK
jgi:hypothetical protein